MLKAADVVSLHCNLDANTHHLMNAERLNMMKVPYLSKRGSLVSVPVAGRRRQSVSATNNPPEAWTDTLRCLFVAL